MEGGYNMSRNTIFSEVETSLKKIGLAETYHNVVLSYLEQENVTVLKADLKSGNFHFLYNSNPDNLVEVYHPTYKEHAESFAHRHIHPDDRNRFFQEIHFWHHKHFGFYLKQHSVYSRVWDLVTGKYRLYEFTTLRTELYNAIERNIILVCKPVEYEF